MLPAEQIAAGVQAADWRAAVTAAGRLLERAGAVEPGRYTAAMLRVVEELGPYIVLAPGLALPHARPEDGVRRPCLAVVALETPVAFGSPENDPVRVVIAFGAPDAKGHTTALAALAGALIKPGALDALMAARSVEEIQNVLLPAVEPGAGEG